MKKSISLLLCMVMVLALFVGFVPTKANADEAEAPADADGIVLNKSASINDDGTYKINLEAFATGTSTSVMTEAEGTPLDIVFIIDQSGSMNDRVSFFGKTRIELLRSALTNFVADIRANGEEYNVDHRIAICGFAGDNNSAGSVDASKRNCKGEDEDGLYWKNTGLFIGEEGNFVKYGKNYWSTDCKLSQQNYQAAMVDCDAINVDNAIANLGYNGATHTKYGLIMARDLLKYNPVNASERKRVVILFTDGDTDDGSAVNKSGYDNLVDIAYDIKNIYGAEIYTVSFGNLSTNDNMTLKRISSNYPYATKYDDAKWVYSKVYGTALDLFNANRYSISYYIKHDSDYDAVYGGGVTMRFDELQYCDNNSSRSMSSGHHDYISDHTNPKNTSSNISKHPYGSGYFTKSHLVANIHDVSPSNAVDQIRFPKSSANNKTVEIHTSASATETKSTVQFYVKQKGDIDGYILQCSESDSLDTAFKNIVDRLTVGEFYTPTLLSFSSFVRDTLGDNFVKDIDRSEVTAKVYDGTYSNGQYVKGAEDTTLTGALDVDISADKGTVDVSGLSYTEEYIADGKAGKMLEITIDNVAIDVKKAFAEDGHLSNTNTDDSGIYDPDANLVEAFKSPKTYVAGLATVIDYAGKREIKMPDIGMSSMSIVKELGDSVNGVYSNESGKLFFDCKTMNWKEEDGGFFIFGKNAKNAIPEQATANTNQASNNNLWANVVAIPANNIYYEDSFVTTQSDDDTKIYYSGNWTTDKADGSSITVTGNEKVHGGGWETVDAKYSGGSAHKISGDNKAGAYAQFTFTGTGVDVYSRTNSDTGVILATLYNHNGDALETKEMKIVNTESASGDYYQIPTVFFNGLKHSTYTVKITVTNKGDYYLDGVRVYNALDVDTQNNNKTVNEAYKDELNAEFISIRDQLINTPVTAAELKNQGVTVPAGADDEEMCILGVAFIDKNGTGEDATADKEAYAIADYKDYGPKNEVYLANGNGIAFNVGNTDKENCYYIGLKAPNGEVTATVSNGKDIKTYNINGATEQYFKVAPSAAGNILVTNDGDDGNILSVTKLRITNPNAPVDTTPFMCFASSDMLTYANSMADLETVQPDDSDVINPDNVDEPDDSGADDEGGKSVSSDVLAELIGMVRNLFSGLKSLFAGIH